MYINRNPSQLGHIGPRTFELPKAQKGIGENCVTTICFPQLAS